MDNIKKNLANIVTLIGLIGAIGAADNKTKIAVLEKTIQVLELTIKEFKMQNDNPLLK